MQFVEQERCPYNRIDKHVYPNKCSNNTLFHQFNCFFSEQTLQFFYMFDKDCNSTGFDADLLRQNSFDWAQAVDQFDLEQSCLLRLKAQREKIEELSRLYEDKEKEITLRDQRERKMKEQLENLEEMAAYKEEWQELKRAHQALLKKNQLAQGELMDLKKEYQGLTSTTSEQADQLRHEVKYLKEQRMLSDANWEAIIADKEEQLKKQARIAQQKEYDLCEQINKLQERIEALEQELSEKNGELQVKKEQCRRQITSRQDDLSAFEKVLETFKKQNNEFKAKIVGMQDTFEKEKSEYLEALDQLRMQVKMLRKDQSEKQNEIYEFKEMIKKCDTKNQALESTVTTLKANLKKFKVNTDTSFKKMSQNSEQERTKQQLFIHELKAELERQMDEKGSMAAEIKRLKGLLERKEQQEKQRKLLLMTEFREIDKMEKVVKKIL